jgi:hypothetical protein
MPRIIMGCGRVSHRVRRLKFQLIGNAFTRLMTVATVRSAMG